MTESPPNWLDEAANQPALCQEPLIRSSIRPLRDCFECGAPYLFNHHSKCWTGQLEMKVEQYEYQSESQSACNA